MNILLAIVLISAVIYLILDYAESARLAALQELSRITFACSLLALLLGGTFR